MLQGLATGLMLAAAQFVARWLLQDEGAVTPLFLALIAPAVFTAPVWKVVADRVGKERAFRLSSLLFLVATLILTAMVWAPGWWILAPVALAGAAYAGMQTLPMAMLPDIIAHDRAYRGDGAHGGSAGRAGMFSGVWTAGETTGMALGATVLSVVLAATGYIESVAGAQAQSQPDAAVTGIALAFSALPALLMLLSIISLGRYRLREQDVPAGHGVTAEPDDAAEPDDGAEPDDSGTQAGTGDPA
jgi:Na+/melibiose symporter-like transporter